MITQSLLAGLILSGGLDLEVVKAATEVLAKGGNPYQVEGVAPRSQEAQAALPDLGGCAPSMVDGSTREYMQIDFNCTADAQPYAHRVWFSQDDDAKVSIYVDPLPIAIGPSSAAPSISDLPSERTQMKRFVRAVQKSKDHSLDGLLPLNEAQDNELASLSDCDWSNPRKSMAGKRTWFSFVRCSHHKGGEGRMLEAEFDKDGRAIAIRISYGARVVR